MGKQRRKKQSAPTQFGQLIRRKLKHFPDATTNDLPVDIQLFERIRLTTGAFIAPQRISALLEDRCNQPTRQEATNLGKVVGLKESQVKKFVPDWSDTTN